MAAAAIIVSLEELAARFPDCRLRGDPHSRIEGVCALSPGLPNRLAFADSQALADSLTSSHAAAVVVDRALASHWAGPCLIASRPRLVFARIAALFELDRRPVAVHPTAVIAGSARLAADVRVGAQAVIGEEARIESGTSIAAGCIIGAGVVIGGDSRIGARVVIEHDTRIGQRVAIEPGAVIGARGFGLVEGPAGLEPVPQLGRVVIGNDVEIGANTTIDRAALDVTRIGNGVKIDNQVHIGHNCTIGEHTVIAGCTGIAGSCTIGARCMIGGGVGIGDHLTIADDVVITAASQVPKDIPEAGVYSSTFRAMPAPVWRRRLALFRALDRIESRLRRLERTRAGKGEQ